MRTVGSCRSRRAAVGCPAFIAGNTGVGLSQRMQSFVLDPAAQPVQRARPGQAAACNVEPEHGAARRQAVPVVRRAGRRRAGSESAAVLPEHRRVQDGACSKPSKRRTSTAIRCRTRSAITPRSRAVSSSATTRRRGSSRSSRAWAIASKGWERTSGPINAIFIDRANGSLWGGSSDFGEDYGIAW